MNNLTLLADALTYIEANLQHTLKTEEIAAACYCSKSTLEKLFKHVNDLSVHDYIVRRRMVCAAKQLLHHPKMSILDLALSYRYSSNEAFTRAFQQIWDCNPSDFLLNYRFSDLYPRLHPPIQEGDDYMKKRKHVDISELYDLFTERKDCYFICSDIQGLIPINEISRKAGDLAIIASMRRISDAAQDEDILFRIGGDEFVLLTNTTDSQQAESIADVIRKQNGTPFTYNDQSIPLSLYVSTTKLSSNNIKYDELFTTLHSVIEHNK